jgi:pimeloyl-ACP methyl ester carboxylesterase
MARPAAVPADRRARAVDARGPIDAPVLVLLHGTRRTRAMWHPQLRDLSDTFRVVVVDLPAHGALADVPFRLADASALVGSVIDGAGGRAIVVGQSLGAYVGLDLAAGHPGRVAGLILANASAEPRSIARRAPRTVGSYLLAAAGERVRGPAGGSGREPSPAGGPRRAGASSWAGADDGGGGADKADGTEAAVPATNGWLFKGGMRALVAALGESFIPRLAAYPGPTLLVNGEEDHLFRHGERAFLAAAVDGRLEVIPGCGHLVSEDQPAAFNAVVRRFAAEVHGADAVAARA